MVPAIEILCSGIEGVGFRSKQDTVLILGGGLQSSGPFLSVVISCSITPFRKHWRTVAIWKLPCRRLWPQTLLSRISKDIGHILNSLKEVIGDYIGGYYRGY